MILSLLVILGCRWLLGPSSSRPGAGACRSCCRSSCCASRSTSACSCRSRRCSTRCAPQGKLSKQPLRESLGRWSNLKLVLLALFGAMAGQAVVGYVSLVYMKLFLTQTLKVDRGDVEPAGRVRR